MAFVAYMKTIKSQHAVVFVICFLAIALFIQRNKISGTSHPRTAQRMSNNTVPQPPQPATVTPAVRPPNPLAPSIARIWPADYKPTKTIVIPDPEHPTTGALSDRLRPGDDFEMIFAPLWTFNPQKLPEATEMVMDEGDGFKSLQQIIEAHKQISAQQGQTWFLNKRTVRFRLKSGTTEQGDILFDIQKVPEHKCKPLPSVEPVTFGKLKVTYDKLQSQQNNTQITIDLSLENTDKTKSIAVALACTAAQYLPNSEKIRGNLVAEDGSEYWLPIDGLTGIRYLNSNPEYLMEIAPGETRRISLQYRSYRGLTRPVSSFRLRSELVVNSDYHADSYPKDYKNQRDILPPGCKIESLILDIPVRELKSE